MLNLLKQFPDKSCIILHDQQVVYSSDQRGVAPLIEYYRQFVQNQHPQSNPHPYSPKVVVIDRVIGKAAMALAILGKAEKVYTPIISQPALELANKYRISVEFDRLVEYIINRTGTGPCPMEACLINESEPEKCYHLILDKQKELQAR